MAFLSIVFLTITIANLVISSPTYDGSVKIPKSCENKELCTVKPEHYPEEDFENYVAKMHEKDKEFMKSPQYQGIPRIVSVYDDENCSVMEEIIQPYIARSNTTSTPKLVVQTKFFQQKVKETTCMSTGSRCFSPEFDDPRYVAKCTPTMGSVQLYVYDTDTKLFEYAPITISMCCTCGIFQN